MVGTYWLVKPYPFQGEMVFNIVHLVNCLPNKVADKPCEVEYFAATMHGLLMINSIACSTCAYITFSYRIEADGAADNLSGRKSMLALFSI